MGHTPYVPGATAEDRIAQVLATAPPERRHTLPAVPETVHVTLAPLPLGSTRVALAMLRDILLIIVLAGVIYFGASALYALGKARDAFNVPAAVPAATAPAVLPADVPEDCALIDACDGWDGE
jgi:hypothetical protein